MNPPENPWLWPATEKEVKHTIHPRNLGVAVSETQHLPLALANEITHRGYAHANWRTIEKAARVRFGDDRMTAVFPPPLPEIGEIVQVIDADYNARGIVVREHNREALTTRMFFDLDTGEWVTFTVKPLVNGIAHTHLHPSQSAMYPAPVNS